MGHFALFLLDEYGVRICFLRGLQVFLIFQMDFSQRICILPIYRYQALPSLIIRLRRMKMTKKLTKFRPATIAIANRIQGITPASLIAIMIFIKNNFYSKKTNKNLQNEQENINKIQSQEI